MGSEEIWSLVLARWKLSGKCCGRVDGVAHMLPYCCLSWQEVVVEFCSRKQPRTAEDRWFTAGARPAVLEGSSLESLVTEA